MNNAARNPFAGYPNTLIVHPGWSEFHYLLAALASLLLLLGVFWFVRWLDNRALWSKGTKVAASLSDCDGERATGFGEPIVPPSVRRQSWQRSPPI
jgi:hypothetical protein